MRTLQKGAGHMNWELDVIMAELAKKVENELRMARRTIGHGITLGEASQQVWLRLLSINAGPPSLPHRHRHG